MTQQQENSTNESARYRAMIAIRMCIGTELTTDSQWNLLRQELTAMSTESLIALSERIHAQVARAFQRGTEVGAQDRKKTPVSSPIPKRPYRITYRCGHVIQHYIYSDTGARYLQKQALDMDCGECEPKRTGPEDETWKKAFNEYVDAERRILLTTPKE